MNSKIKFSTLILLLAILFSSCKFKETGGTTSVGEPISTEPLQAYNCEKLFSLRDKKEISDQYLLSPIYGDYKKFCNVDQALILYNSIALKEEPIPLAVDYFLASKNGSAKNKDEERQYCRNLGGEIIIYTEKNIPFEICSFVDRSEISIKTLFEGYELHKVLSDYLRQD